MTTRLSAKNHVGLVIATLLGIADLTSLAGVAAADEPGHVGAPVPVLVADAVLGAVTLVAAGLAWGGLRRRPSLRVAALARVISMVTALPAFFVSGVPSAVVALVALAVVVTLVDVWLLLARVRPAVESAPATA